jgi:hypothetical protein
VRSGRLGGRRAAVAGLLGNAVGVALPVVVLAALV